MFTETLMNNVMSVKTKCKKDLKSQPKEKGLKKYLFKINFENFKS